MTSFAGTSKSEIIKVRYKVGEILENHLSRNDNEAIDRKLIKNED
jgi:hypothetical protein